MAREQPCLPPRILLLEDDHALQEIITAFLESHSYAVVAVQNGAEGIREVIADDFEVIICDMMMPRLAGDMFYLAVERMKPHLCKRFIFTTGHHDNPKIRKFIQDVRGTVLPKPFRVDDLLEVIGLIRLRGLL